MPSLEGINGCLDTLVRPQLRAWNRLWPTFEVCECIGLIGAVVLILSLAISLRLSLWVTVAVSLSAILIALGVIIANKLLFDVERLVYYNFQIAVLGGTMLLLWGVHQPILPYLDITSLGLGLCLACTRIGCLMVGCCHGRPHTIGVCYGPQHAKAGFVPYYVGVRLFPIQAVECLWVFGIVLFGIIYLFTASVPGEVVAWYIVAYGVGRFYFEFVRGDVGRSYWGGFSQAQWTSLVLVSGVVGAGFINILPWQWWQVGGWIGMMGTAIAISVYRTLDPTDRYHLLHPHHVEEIAKALDLRSAWSSKDASSDNCGIRCTSLGIQISAGHSHTQTGPIDYYVLSSQREVMTVAMARTLTKLILRLDPDIGSSELIQKNQGVFHLVVYPLTGPQVSCC